MRFWWVNQNQTYRHEVSGGYLWSPKRKSNGTQNPFYDFMREVRPGDVIFSFADTLVKAIGIAQSYAGEAPKPMEFGSSGAYWDQIGWRVDVRFQELGPHAIRPASHMALLAPLLPEKYAPLQESGAGLQSVYLTLLPDRLASMLVDLIGTEARRLVMSLRVEEPTNVPPTTSGQIAWEEHVVESIRSDETVPSTERAAILLARRGQGLFKSRVMKLERACRVTGVREIEHLRASHCLPWRNATNAQRLDGENGLLLTPTIDHLFDRGFITFENNGDLLVAPVATRDSMTKMGIDPAVRMNVGGFSEGQRSYLDFHRSSVFLKSKFIADA